MSSRSSVDSAERNSPMPPSAGGRVRQSFVKGLQKLKETVTFSPTPPPPPPPAAPTGAGARESERAAPTAS